MLFYSACLAQIRIRLDTTELLAKADQRLTARVETRRLAAG
jgi:hypothetical protein